MTRAEQLRKIANMDYMVIVNSIDIKTNHAVVKEYNVIGNGQFFPEQTTTGVQSLLNILQYEEIKEGRVAIDVTTLISYSGETVWDSPAILGPVVLK